MRALFQKPLVGAPLWLAAGLSVAVCSKSQRSETGAADDGASVARAARAQVDLFAFGRVRGTVAPCGCTTEPLGGLAYAFGLLGQQPATTTVVVEPGSFLYPDPQGPEPPEDEAAWAQAEQRAKILHARFADLGSHLVSGLGPLDVASPHGTKALTDHPLPRVLANAAPPSENGAPLWSEPAFRTVKVRAGDQAVTFGVTAVVDPAVGGADRLGPLTDPTVAVERAVADMKKAGVTIPVAIVHGPRATAEAVARDVDGLHFVVVGHVTGLERQRLGAPVARLGDTFVLEPGEQLQTVSHATLSFQAGADLSSTRSWKLLTPKATRREEIERLDARIAKFSADPQADPAFVARLRSEREALAHALETDGDVEAPVTLLVEQQKVTCKAPVDKNAKAQLQAYDAWVAKKNKARFAGVEPPPPKKGEPGYVGIEECSLCHDEAEAFWKKTLHAGAYKTLVDANKQYDLSCVGCHVTGFREPGGSEVVENEGLRDVQCEICHGPGSLHAEDPEKNGQPHAISLRAPEDVCGACHTPDHSDTFQYEAYLRDILGKGHGEDARKALGDGPTGHELRAAGLAKAGGSCQKM